MASLIWKFKRFLAQKKKESLRKFKKTSAFYPIKVVLVSIIYYRRTWARSEAKKKLEEYTKIFLQKYNDFNLVNTCTRLLSRLAAKAKLPKAAEFLRTSMQEESGINRHVLFRYLMKELFLYFFIRICFTRP